MVFVVFWFSERYFSDEAIAPAVNDVGAVIPRLEPLGLENRVSMAETGHAKLDECFHG